MIIKLDFVENPELKMVLETTSDLPHAKVDVIATGDDFLIELLKQELENKTGFAGHLFEWGSTTNLDLIAATSNLTAFVVVSTTPKIISEPLPEGVQS